jgi:tagaturonate reductase
MKRLDRANMALYKERLPIKVVQFGGGNFLRTFADYLIDEMNQKTDFNAGIAVVKPTPGRGIEPLNEQDGLYHLFIKGLENGREIEEVRVISCIQKGINPYTDQADFLALAKGKELELLISNTTESGIAFDESDTLEGPYKSFPAKVTALLHTRYEYFEGATDKGLTIMPCELTDRNADALKEIVLWYAELWKLEVGFVEWLEAHNSFLNTLVDRIVSGYPEDDINAYQSELEYEDRLIVTSEVYLLWVIEGGEELRSKIPFDAIDENILIVDDLQPYRTRKVRILNGAHTSMVPFSILFGNETVKETMDDKFTGTFIKKTVFEEINPTLGFPSGELEAFAEAIFDRFKNPFIRHRLSNIALNSISKFRVRVLPSLLTFQKRYGRLPSRLTFAFACLIRFYGGQWKGKQLPVNDEEQLVSEMKNIWACKNYETIAEKTLKKLDLTKISELKRQMAFVLKAIDTKGIQKGYETFSLEFPPLQNKENHEE